MISALDSTKAEVTAFVEALYRLPTIAYATNHSMMETWVALEGLQFFRGREWACWETLGFVTSKPVRTKDPKKNFGIKFPDIVAVRNGLTLWFEFKGICRSALHTANLGGTLVDDALALAAFSGRETAKYLAKGTHPIARPRSDRTNIEASGLREYGLGRRANVGVVMLLAPGDDEVSCPAPGGPQWRPADTIERLDGRLGVISTSLGNISGTPTSTRPRCHVWLVPMEDGPDAGA